MPYRNVYDEQKTVRQYSNNNNEPERDPRKIAQIYASQMPSADEFEERQKKLTAPNLTAPNGVMINSANARRKLNRGIKRSIKDR